jgi:hypothetical protein
MTRTRFTNARRRRRRAAFAIVELPAMVAMLAMLGGMAMCVGGHCTLGIVVAVIGAAPMALLVLPSLFRKD